MKELLEKYAKHEIIAEVEEVARSKKTGYISISGLSGSIATLMAHRLMDRLKGSHLLVFPDKEEAAYFYNDIVNIEGTDRAFFFPSSYTRSIQYKKTDEGNIITRTRVLKRLGERRTSSFVITYPEALMERVISRKKLNSSSFELKTGEKISRDFLEDLLRTYNFEMVDFVYGPGQYAIRGSLIDVFSFSSKNPFRIDFFGDEVESLRTFDPETQLSINPLKKISLVPNIQWENQEENLDKRVSFFEYLPSHTTVWFKDMNQVFHKIDEIYEKADIEAESEGRIQKAEVITNSKELKGQTQNLLVFEIDPPIKLKSDYIFNSSPQPVFNRNFELLSENILVNNNNGYDVFILSDSESQIKRLRDIFAEINHVGVKTDLEMGILNGPNFERKAT